MSDQPRIIEGDYADFKLIKTRQVCQVVIEVPLEDAEKVTRLLGFPKPGTGTRCAVALLNDSAKLAGGKIPTRGAEEQSRERLNETPPAKPNIRRAMALVRDFEFREFAGTATEVEALDFIRNSCGIKSRTELDVLPGSERFDKLCRDFQSWRHARAA